MKLYEIKEDYLTVLDMAENDEIDADAIKDTLASIEGEFAEKVDNIACIIKQLYADAKAIKEEQDKLADRAKARKAKGDRLKAYLYEQMSAIGQRKIETSRNILTIANNAPSVKVDDETSFFAWAAMDHEDYIKQKAPELDKTAIKDALKNGLEIPGVHLEAGESLRLK